MHAAGAEEIRHHCRLALEAAQRCGQVARALDPRAEARALAAFADGLAVQRAVEPELITDRQVQVRRIGNQAGHEESPIALGDHKTDPDAELERPTRVSLIDTRTGGLRLVDVGASYSFRSLGRGPHGEALVLGTDGALRTIDPETGKITATVKVVEPWREPTEWQEARPALHVRDRTAYVPDPARKEVHAVDIETGKVQVTGRLPHAPNEIATA
ncbi:TetR family transcriptional regulator C-terminal domain-containing protein [Spirillospora sp. CA-253888]